MIRILLVTFQVTEVLEVSDGMTVQGCIDIARGAAAKKLRDGKAKSNRLHARIAVTPKDKKLAVDIARDEGMISVE